MSCSEKPPKAVGISSTSTEVRSFIFHGLTSVSLSFINSSNRASLLLDI